MNFNVKGLNLPPVDVDRCLIELPDLSAGLVIFDAFVLNHDRHTGNFAVDFAEKPPLMNVYDFSHALLGVTAGAGQAHLAANASSLGIVGPPNRHCLLDKLTTNLGFGKWIDRISAIPDHVIDDITEQSIALGVTRAEQQSVATFLKQRRRDLSSIIKKHSAEFKSISQWSLIW